MPPSFNWPTNECVQQMRTIRIEMLRIAKCFALEITSILSGGLAFTVCLDTDEHTVAD